MSNRLTVILEAKAAHVARTRAHRPLEVVRAAAHMAAPVRGFHRALQARIEQGHAAIIAEIKKASPSKGILREDFQPVAIARSYDQAGAACLSVLTDGPFFQGSDEDLQAVRANCTRPLLRKDFVIDPYQVYEARALGADCILLIVAALDDTRLRLLYDTAQALGLDVLVEVHDAPELERAHALGATLIGINNRNLATFETCIETSIALSRQAPPRSLLVTESGILERAHVQSLFAAGIRAFLVGEAFMRCADPGEGIRQLFQGVL